MRYLEEKYPYKEGRQEKDSPGHFQSRPFSECQQLCTAGCGIALWVSPLSSLLENYCLVPDLMGSATAQHREHIQEKKEKQKIKFRGWLSLFLACLQVIWRCMQLIFKDLGSRGCCQFLRYKKPKCAAFLVIDDGLQKLPK